MGRPLGRPTKYDPEIMLPKIIDCMKQGMSQCEVACNLGICEDTLYEWIKIHPAFSEALKKGKWYSQAWWETQGRINLENRDFSPALWFINMKNRHGWKDKQETNINIIPQETCVKDLD